ncbi:MAG: DUF4192 family protein [Galactobacter sp.]
MNSSARDRRHHHMSTNAISPQRHKPPAAANRTRKEGDVTVVKAGSDAELLGLVPSLMGYHPKESLIVIPFAGKHCGTGMRINLPPRASSSTIDTLASLCVSSLSKMDHCNAAMLAVFTDESFIKAVRGYRMTLKRLELALLRQGFGIRRTFVRAADGWSEIDDPDAPVGGYDPAQLDEALPAGLQRHTADEPTPPERDARLPEPDTARARLLRGELDLLAAGRERTALGVLIPAQPVDHVQLVEQLLEKDPPQLAVITMARFCISALQPALRDPMLVQLAFGESVGESARDHNIRHHERMRETGLSSDELAMRDLAQGRAVERDVAMIMGDWPEAPDADRLRNAQDVVAHIAAHCPTWARPPVLCVLGWLYWAGGGGSAAGAHLQEALRLDPSLRMAALLLALVDSGKLPEWGFRSMDRMVSLLGDGGGRSDPGRNRDAA